MCRAAEFMSYFASAARAYVRPEPGRRIRCPSLLAFPANWILSSKESRQQLEKYNCWKCFFISVNWKTSRIWFLNVKGQMPLMQPLAKDSLSHWLPQLRILLISTQSWHLQGFMPWAGQRSTRVDATELEFLLHETWQVSLSGSLKLLAEKQSNDLYKKYVNLCSIDTGQGWLPLRVPKTPQSEHPTCLNLLGAQEHRTT